MQLNLSNFKDNPTSTNLMFVRNVKNRKKSRQTTKSSDVFLMDLGGKQKSFFSKLEDRFGDHQNQEEIRRLITNVKMQPLGDTGNL